jgi:hypothetical protein
MPTENTSINGTDMDDDDRSMLEMLEATETDSNPQIFKSVVSIKVNSILSNFLGFIPFGESFI